MGNEALERQLEQKRVERLSAKGCGHDATVASNRPASRLDGWFDGWCLMGGLISGSDVKLNQQSGDPPIGADRHFLHSTLL